MKGIQSPAVKSSPTEKCNCGGQVQPQQRGEAPQPKYQSFSTHAKHPLFVMVQEILRMYSIVRSTSHTWRQLLFCRFNDLYLRNQSVNTNAAAVTCFFFGSSEEVLKVIHDFQMTKRISNWPCTAACWHEITKTSWQEARTKWLQENYREVTQSYLRGWRTCCPWMDLSKTWNSQWNSIIHNPLLIFNPGRIRRHSIRFFFPPSMQRFDTVENPVSGSNNTYKSHMR